MLVLWLPLVLAYCLAVAVLPVLGQPVQSTNDTFASIYAAQPEICVAAPVVSLKETAGPASADRDQGAVVRVAMVASWTRQSAVDRVAPIATDERAVKSRAVSPSQARAPPAHAG